MATDSRAPAQSGHHPRDWVANILGNQWPSRAKILKEHEKKRSMRRNCLVAAWAVLDIMFRINRANMSILSSLLNNILTLISTSGTYLVFGDQYMHRLQQAILEFASRQPLEGMTLREIGDHIGEKHPQKIKHHLNQLRAKGILVSGDKPRAVKIGTIQGKGQAKMLSIPILGAANCGDPREFAIENLEGYLTVSPSMVPRKKRLFAVRAVGSSMNHANIEGKSIEDGDYVIVDPETKTPKNGEYVLSVIGGSANIKRFCKDQETDQIVLISESAQELPPIYIHPNDFADDMVNGKVVQVIKKPKIKQ
ncbi:MAG: hypothetical protein HQM16_02855 [Deltaproteobacteria bacterium]|nr:hypothetical protein [Deltaproteobacteria bacterium]